MNNYCTNCGEKLESNATKCSKCGQDVVDLRELNNQSDSFSKFLKIFFKIILLIVLIIIGLVIFNKISIKYKGKSYINEYVMPNLKSNNFTNINRVTYEKRKNCVERYSTCAGDTGSGRKKIKNCYYYYYNVDLNDEKQSKVYLKDFNGTINIYNEIYYTNSSHAILNYYNNIFFDKAELEFSYFNLIDDIDYEEHNGYLNKTITLKTKLNSKGAFNREYAEKFIQLIKYSKQFENKENILEFSVKLKFSDNYVLTFDEPSGMFYFTIVDHENYTSNEFSIDKNSSDNVIKWSISNRLDSSYYYANNNYGRSDNYD